MTRTILAGVALAAMLPLASAAVADPFDPFRIFRDYSTRFDLGVDASRVALNPAAVGAYLATLKPETRRLVLSGCRHYLAHPEGVQSPATLPFCAIAVKV